VHGRGASSRPPPLAARVPRASDLASPTNAPGHCFRHRRDFTYPASSDSLSTLLTPRAMSRMPNRFLIASSTRQAGAMPRSRVAAHAGARGNRRRTPVAVIVPTMVEESENRLARTIGDLAVEMQAQTNTYDTLCTIVSAAADIVPGALGPESP
jgi:hypothetical protein